MNLFGQMLLVPTTSLHAKAAAGQIGLFSPGTNQLTTNGGSIPSRVCVWLLHIVKGVVVVKLFPSIRRFIHPWMASYREENPGRNK
jgi:hypothetical protein